jgi:hypothetical protein
LTKSQDQVPESAVQRECHSAGLDFFADVVLNRHGNELTHRLKKMTDSRCRFKTVNPEFGVEDGVQYTITLALLGRLKNLPWICSNLKGAYERVEAEGRDADAELRKSFCSAGPSGDVASWALELCNYLAQTSGNCAGGERRHDWGHKARWAAAPGQVLLYDAKCGGAIECGGSEHVRDAFDAVSEVEEEAQYQTALWKAANEYASFTEMNDALKVFFPYYMLRRGAFGETIDQSIAMAESLSGHRRPASRMTMNRKERAFSEWSKRNRRAA